MVAAVLTAMAAGAACWSDTPPDVDGARAQALIERCVRGRLGEEDAQRFVGMAESDVRDEAEDQGLKVRVLGEDRECFARTDDLRDDRLNVLLVDNYVVWADLF